MFNKPDWSKLQVNETKHQLFIIDYIILLFVSLISTLNGVRFITNMSGKKIQNRIWNSWKFGKKIQNRSRKCVKIQKKIQNRIRKCVRIQKKFRIKYENLWKSVKIWKNNDWLNGIVNSPQLCEIWHSYCASWQEPIVADGEAGRGKSAAYTAPDRRPPFIPPELPPSSLNTLVQTTNTSDCHIRSNEV